MSCIVVKTMIPPMRMNRTIAIGREMRIRLYTRGTVSLGRSVEFRLT